MTLKTPLTSLLLSALLLGPALAQSSAPSVPVPSNAPARGASRDVDLVICLDTSGSMNGLIESCRKKIWDMCSLLAQARPQPRLRVALLSFGGSQNPEGGFVVVESPFSEELDGVYEKLMALQTSGSVELVGRVLHESLNHLQWSPDSRALKMIFVAGNESADQDSAHPFRQQVQAALQHGIVVNSIFCGPDAVTGDAAGWREIATLGGGEYAAINQEGTVAIPTPFDAEISRLGTEINGTYLAYGRTGARMQARQTAQDANAAKVSKETLASRMQLKGSSLYRNGSWDLVDCYRRDDFDWSKVPEDELPEVLKGKTVAQREAYLKGLIAKRKGIQARLEAAGKKRTAFITAELKKRAGENAKSLDFAVAKAVKKAAEKAGFRFE